MAPSVPAANDDGRLVARGGRIREGSIRAYLAELSDEVVRPPSQVIGFDFATHAPESSTFYFERQFDRFFQSRRHLVDIVRINNHRVGELIGRARKFAQNQD